MPSIDRSQHIRTPMGNVRKFRVCIRHTGILGIYVFTIALCRRTVAGKLLRRGIPGLQNEGTSFHRLPQCLTDCSTGSEQRLCDLYRLICDLRNGLFWSPLRLGMRGLRISSARPFRPVFCNSSYHAIGRRRLRMKDSQLCCAR
jgi:hypothetical protein